MNARGSARRRDGCAAMYDIEMAEISEEFARCWGAAGQHIESRVQGRFRMALGSSRCLIRRSHQLRYVIDKDSLLGCGGQFVTYHWPTNEPHSIPWVVDHLEDGAVGLHKSGPDSDRHEIDWLAHLTTPLAIEALGR